MPTEWVEEWVATKNEFLDNPARNVMGFKITGPGAARLLELRKQMVKSLHDGEAKLLVGTDALQLFMIPGFSVRAEMALRPTPKSVNTTPLLRSDRLPSASRPV